MIHPSQEFRLKTKTSTKQSLQLQVPVNGLLGQEQGCTALPTGTLGSAAQGQDQVLLSKPWQTK